MNISKKIIIFSSVILAVSFLFSGAAILISSSAASKLVMNNNEEITVPGESAISISGQLYTESVYVLREYNGIIGIYNSYGSLIETLEVYVKTLPESDRSMLREGIYADSREELLALIEDFTG